MEIGAEVARSKEISDLVSEADPKQMVELVLKARNRNSESDRWSCFNMV